MGVVLLLLPQRITKGFNFLFVRVFNPVLGIGREAEREVFQPRLASKDFVTRAEYNRLYTAYHNILADFKTEHRRYEKLAQIRSSLPTPGPGLILADVITPSIKGLRHELVINRGESDGLKAGQYVLGENSVIGTVSETAETTARVRLITDSKHKIKVGIWRKGKKKYIPGQMNGDGKNTCRIPLISREYDIRPGDIVYATIRAGFLHTPRIIGTVSELKPDEKEPLLWDITVKPIQEAPTMVEVAIIVTNTEVK